MTIHYLKRNIIRLIFITSAGFALTQLSASWLCLTLVQFRIERDSEQFITKTKYNFNHERAYLSTLILPNTCSNDVHQALQKRNKICLCDSLDILSSSAINIFIRPSLLSCNTLSERYNAFPLNTSTSIPA